MKKLIKSLANSFGYDIKRTQPIATDSGFELYQYLKADGAFDYEKYKQTQIAGNKRKIENIWVLEENVEFLANYLKKSLDGIEFGLCHGTRRGKEQEWFRKYLDCEVIGTEISDTADQFPHTIQWDFHESKPEWKDAVDFIYSNSFDHSYDPQKCLREWVSCLKKGGVCILEHTSGHEDATELDPFGADVGLMPYLILTWGAGDFCVTELLHAPAKSDKLSYVHYLIIKRV